MFDSFFFQEDTVVIEKLIQKWELEINSKETSPKISWKKDFLLLLLSQPEYLWKLHEDGLKTVEKYERTCSSF